MTAVRFWLCLCICSFLTAFVPVSAGAAPKQLILAHADVPGSISDITAKEFARRLNKKLAGRYEVIVKTGPGLGSEEALLDLVKKGKIAFSLHFMSLAGKMPGVLAFKLPSLVQSRQQVQKARNTLLKTYFVPEARHEGLEMLAMWDNGFKHVSSDLPSTALTPFGDIKGAIVRVAPGSLEARYYAKAGVAVKEIPSERLYEALKAKEVTVQTSSLADIVFGHYYEVQKYLILSGVSYQPSFLVTSHQHFSLIESDAKKVIESVATELQDWSMKTGEAEEAKMIAELKTKMTVEEVDRFVILLRLIPLYQTYSRENPAVRPLVKVLFDQTATGVNLR